jgi:DNA modification methylase
MKPYYEHGGITIYHGDCREVLPHVSADLLLTDPPYGIAHASNYTCETTTAGWMNAAIAGDGNCALRDFALAGRSEWACFGSPRVSAPSGVRGTVVWDKGPASGMGDLSWPWKLSWELVFLAGEGWRGSRDEGVIKGYSIVTRASMGRCHPNEKPVGLLTYLLGKHESRTVVDPFMGSGTTLRAAKDLGRKAIGIEIEERYCEIAAKRLSQEVLFGAGA